MQHIAFVGPGRNSPPKKYVISRRQKMARWIVGRSGRRRFACRVIEIKTTVLPYRETWQ
jgi:hypothetical protein